MIKVDMDLDDAIDYCKMQSIFHQDQLSSLRKEKADPTLIYSEILQIKQIETVSKYLQELKNIKDIYGKVDDDIQFIDDIIKYYEREAERTRGQDLNLIPYSYEEGAALFRQLKIYKETIPGILDKLTSYDEQLKELDKKASDLETIITEKTKSKEESHQCILTPDDVIDDAMKELRNIRGDDTSLPFEVAQALDMGITALLEWKRFEKAIESIKEEAADMNGPSNVEITPLTVDALDRLANHYLEKVRRGEWET